MHFMIEITGNADVRIECGAVGKADTLFAPLTEDRVLYDLAESHRQISEGRCSDMREALSALHGFIRYSNHGLRFRPS